MTELPANDPPLPGAVDPLATTGQAPEADAEDAAEAEGDDPREASIDLEATVNLTGDDELFQKVSAQRLALGDEQEDKAEPNQTETPDDVSRTHLKGLLEALVFASDKPIKSGELAKSAAAHAKLVKELLGELKAEYHERGIQLDEVAGGWVFRTSAAYAPFIRDMTKQKPVRLTRAQVETLAIIAYRQPITRPEVDDIRGVDSGPVLKLLLERDLVRIMGKKDEPGRPLLYGSTNAFLEFFGLRSLKDLPTLSEFTELSEDSRRVVERELGDVLDHTQPSEGVAEPARPEGSSDATGGDAPGPAGADEGTAPSPDDGLPHDTIAPPADAPPPHDEPSAKRAGSESD